MIDRKQEKTRRVRGSNLMRDLMTTQGAVVLTLPEHFKLFQNLSRETNFYFRTDMAESLGHVKCCLRHFNIGKEEFQRIYLDEFMELVSDSDNQVRIKAFEAVARLVHQEEIDRECILPETKVADDIFPQFLKLLEMVLEDEDGMQQMSQIFGLFVHSLHRKFEQLVMKNTLGLCKFYEHCARSKDA